MSRRASYVGVIAVSISVASCSSNGTPSSSNPAPSGAAGHAATQAGVGGAHDAQGGADGAGLTGGSASSQGGANAGVGASSGQGGAGHANVAAGASGASGSSAQAGVSGAAGSKSAAGAGGSGGLSGGGTAGNAGASAGSTDCPDWTPCDDGEASTTGDVCSDGVCAGASPTQPLVVHEWGTYTSVKASDGHTLRGVHHIDERLPTWVHSRATDEPWGYAIEGIPDEPLQQLETPVLYFHSDVPRALTVSVNFPEGVVGEWFPLATAFSPAIGSLTALSKGSMSWGITVDPSIAVSSFLPVTPDEIWAPSRQVSSTPVHAQGTEAEQFIFYRGLGQFDPPVTVSAPDDQTLHIQNTGSACSAAFLLSVSGTMGAFVPLGPLPSSGAFDIPIPTLSMTSAEMIAAAQSGLQAALQTTGLYPDEAQAMVDTWTRSWFSSDGLRVLYLAPREWTDGWLPTTITPTPTEIVRTLVGRIEVLTPGNEADVIQQITASQTSGIALDTDDLGRFAEPRIFRAMEQITDPQLLAWATLLQQNSHIDNNYPLVTRAPYAAAHSSGSSPTSTPTDSSIASNGSARTFSPRSAVSATRYPSALHRNTSSDPSAGSTSQ